MLQMADSEVPARSQFFSIPDVIKAIHSLPGRGNATENEEILRRQVNAIIMLRPNLRQNWPSEKMPRRWMTSNLQFTAGGIAMA